MWCSWPVSGSALSASCSSANLDPSACCCLRGPSSAGQRQARCRTVPASSQPHGQRAEEASGGVACALRATDHRQPTKALRAEELQAACFA
eukprot:6508374-Pyramimonas_sp.AAC.1